MNYLGGLLRLPPNFETPTFYNIRGNTRIAEGLATDNIVFRNCIANPYVETTINHSPGFVSMHGVGYDYEPFIKAPLWEQTLQEVFDGDKESIETLQEMIGYLMVSDTSQQKIFAIIGQKRSGKGTIGRVLHDLIGREHVRHPTLDSLKT